MKTQSIFRSALVAIAAAGIIFVATAPAAATDEAPQARIHLSHLDLSDPADRNTVARRIRDSAVRVCASGDGRQLVERMEVRRCYKAAIKSADEQLATIEARRGATLAQLGTKGDSVRPE